MPHPQPTCVVEGVEHGCPRTVENMFPGEMTTPGAARRMVRDHLETAGCLSDDCALIVSELVTNAVVHGGGAVRLRLTAHRRWIYAEISDDGRGFPRESPEDLDATDGRGLLIVGSLATEWGVVPLPDGGKIVWFILGDD